ncbi:MAG: amidohydrolase family protein [Clostridia bacterium]|nr:amidohydrolase family protein [Clostridia bacterium]
MLAITNGHIITMEGTEYNCGTLLVRDGVIQQVGDNIDIPEHAQVYDIKGKYLMPGMIDSHCHLGVSQDLQSLEAEREFMDDYILPNLRVIDAINSQAVGFAAAREAGITSVAVSPGSTCVVGGQIAVVKTLAGVVDHIVLREPAALKMALGEIFTYRGLHREPTTQARMMVTASLREAFVRAENYAREDKDLDLSMDIIIQAKRGRLPVFVHARRADDMMTALRLAREFSLDLVIVHGNECENIANYLVNYEVPVVISPISYNKADDPESIDWSNLARLEASGLKIAFCTDYPIMPIGSLRGFAVKAHEAGFSREASLAAITINGASILDVDDEVGSLAEEKEADFVILDGDPLKAESKVLEVWIKGHRVFERE